jgi:chorismate dehydratase
MKGNFIRSANIPPFSKWLKSCGALAGGIESGMSNPVRIASVSYLNARPLIYGLEQEKDHKLFLDVPAKLIDLLRDDRADVALLPVIDYQRMEGLRIVPAGGIGSDAETLTVRIFSRKPIDRIETLACDIESHTSVALAKIIFAEAYGIWPEFVELSKLSPKSDAARLLIGDKVVCDEPVGFSHQLDLGAAWNKLTGLPFVFAVWIARGGIELGDLPARLERAKQQGLAHVNEIIEQFAIPRGWPGALAKQYLTVNLNYDIGAPQLDAIQLFHQYASKHGIVQTIQPLRMA